jgi:spermidine/putrescine transport system substrate-binding protein
MLITKKNGGRMKKTIVLSFVLLLILILTLSFGCKSGNVSKTASSVTTAAQTAQASDTAKAEETTTAAEVKKELKSLNIYVWEGYLPEKAAKMFEEETGIKLNISLASDNGTMITLLEGGGKADLIMPTQNQVNRLYEQNLALPLDLTKIPNYKNVGNSFKNQTWSMWDGKALGAGDTYVIPYVFGTSGLIINKNKYKGAIDNNIGWDILFDKNLKARVSSKNSAESIMICLDLAGIPRSDLLKDANGTLEKVRTKVMELKKNVLKFYSTGAEIMDLLKNEEVWVSHMWDGGGRKLMSTDPKFIYVLPKTGGMGWSDTFMIPSDADNPQGAYKFIDFMLRPDIAALVTEEGNTTTVTGAMDLANVESKELYKFTDDQLKNLVWQLNLPKSVIDSYTAFWEEISTSN